MELWITHLSSLPLKPHLAVLFRLQQELPATQLKLGRRVGLAFCCHEHWGVQQLVQSLLEGVITYYATDVLHIRHHFTQLAGALALVPQDVRRRLQRGLECTWRKAIVVRCIVPE